MTWQKMPLVWKIFKIKAERGSLCEQNIIQSGGKNTHPVILFLSKKKIIIIIPLKSIRTEAPEPHVALEPLYCVSLVGRKILFNSKSNVFFDYKANQAEDAHSQTVEAY